MGRSCCSSTARPELLERTATLGRKAASRNTAAIWLEPLTSHSDAGRLLEDLLAGVLTGRAARRPSRCRRRVFRSSSRSSSAGLIDRRRPCQARSRSAGRLRDDNPDVDGAGFGPGRPSPPASTCCRRSRREALQAAAVIGRVFWHSRSSISLGGAKARSSGCSRNVISSGAGSGRRSQRATSMGSSTRSRARSRTRRSRRRAAPGFTPRWRAGSNAKRPVRIRLLRSWRITMRRRRDPRTQTWPGEATPASSSGFATAPVRG